MFYIPSKIDSERITETNDDDTGDATLTLDLLKIKSNNTNEYGPMGV